MASTIKVDTILDSAGNAFDWTASGLAPLASPTFTGTATAGAFSGDGSALTGVGKVLQIVSATKSDTQSTSLQAWVDVTGLSVSITPTNTSSKILVIVAVQGSGSNRYSAIRVARNGSAVGVGDTGGSRTSVLSGFGLDPDAGANYIHVLYNAGGSFVDSPVSTSSQTYKVQFGSTNDNVTTYINRTENDADALYSLRGISTITLMEISA